MTDPDQELIELLQTKAPEELTREEIERLRAALVHSAPLQQALAGALEMEQYLNAALGTPRLSADHIISGTRRLSPSAGRGLLSLLKWAVCLLLAGFVGSVLIMAMVMPPAPNVAEPVKLAAKEEGSGKADRSDMPARAAKPHEVEAAVGAMPPPPPADAPVDQKPAGAETTDVAEASSAEADKKPAVAAEPGPWPNPAVLAAQPAPAGAEALDDFNARTSAPTEADLRQWFAKVPGRPNTLANHQAHNAACGLIDGLLRLRSPWAPHVALRFTAQEHSKLRVHLWRGDRGLTLHYYESYRRGWVAYETTRKPGTTAADSWQTVGDDEGRNARRQPVGSLDV